MDQLTLIKVGGKIVEEEASLRQLLADFAQIAGHKVLVHGGGRSATALAARLGIESRMVNGRRITDADMLRVVTMVYGGLVNKQVVAGLQALGVNALGLTGADMDYMRSAKRPAGEVDYGFVGDVRQVNAALLAAEMTAACKLEGRTLCQALDGLYAEHGTWFTKADSFAFTGPAPMEAMAAVMERLRRETIDAVAGSPVTVRTDYARDDTGLPRADVLAWELADGCRVIARPSGTEPKLKIYFTVVGRTRKEAAGRLEEYRAFMKERLA